MPPTRTTELRPAADGLPPVEIVRSRKRRRGASAFERDGVIVVQVPANLPQAEEHRLVTSLVRRVAGKVATRGVGGDEWLEERAHELADAYLDGVRPNSIRWSNRMTRRWGSCSVEERAIRISDQLASMPGYVIDDVIVHELAHLVHPDHSPAFYELAARHPAHERAEAYLAGVQRGKALAWVRHEPEVKAGDAPTPAPVRIAPRLRRKPADVAQASLFDAT